MGDKSAIEWTDASWNPVTGCDRVGSPGCENCYALTLAKRLKKMGVANYQRDGDPRTSGEGFGLTLHPEMLEVPVRWKRPRLVFVNSMSDLFHRHVPDSFIAAVFATMAIARQHTFQVLTKRPQRMRTLLSDQSPYNDDCNWWWNHVDGIDLDGTLSASGATVFSTGFHDWLEYLGHRELAYNEVVLQNVWLGTSIETDAYTYRADHLRATPAAVRFLSLEPLLGPLPSLDLTGIDWVIVGGESGPGARPMHPAWVRDIRDRCIDECVPFFFKQWGAWGPAGKWRGPDHHMTDAGVLYAPGEPLPKDMFLAAMHRWGKHAAGRELDGRTWDEMPDYAGAAA